MYTTKYELQYKTYQLVNCIKADETNKQQLLLQKAAMQRTLYFEILNKVVKIKIKKINYKNKHKYIQCFVTY